MRIWNWARRAVWGLLVLYVAGVGVLYLFQQRLLYGPVRRVETPESSGLAGFRLETLRTADGLALPVWRHDGDPKAPVVLVFHGKGATLSTMAGRMRRLAEAGLGVWAMEYRGFADAPGSPDQAALTADAVALIDAVRATGVSEARLALYGWSLGSAVALHAAAERRVARIALEAPASAIVDIAAARYPFAPVRLLMRDQWRSLDLFPAIAASVLIVHGTADRTIPIAQGRQLAEAFEARARFVAIADGGHANLDRMGGLDAIVAFLAAPVP